MRAPGRGTESQRTAARREALPDDSPAGQLRAFYAMFPLHTDAPQSLSQMFAAAGASSLQLSRGEYAVVTDRQTGLVLLRMTLPVRGGLRRSASSSLPSLGAVPALALDELTFERPNISRTQVQARAPDAVPRLAS